MNAIKTYLENIFKGLPRTNEVLKVKEDLLSNMVDKYNELVYEGKTKNEAVGIVISEFGDIDEIMSELGISTTQTPTDNVSSTTASVSSTTTVTSTTLREDEVNDYINTTKRSGLKIATGVFLCIIGAALLMLVNQFIEDGYIQVSSAFKDVLSLAPLFILVTIAVGLFINAGMKDEEYEYIKKDNINLPTYVKDEVTRRREAFKPIHTVNVIISVSMLILSPLLVILTSNMSDSTSVYSVIVMLVIVSIAVFMLILVSTIMDSYKHLLNENKVKE